MRVHVWRLWGSSVLFLLLATNVAERIHAATRFCAHCGGSDGCQKVCRLVCEKKKVTITCWGCKEEDFCVPGPSSLASKHCETVCVDDLDPKSPCVEPKKYAWNEWFPGNCAKVYTKKKLMKRTITKSIPSFKWVVEDLCPQCEAQCEVPEVPSGTTVPPMPKTDAVILTPAR